MDKNKNALSTVGVDKQIQETAFVAEILPISLIVSAEEKLKRFDSLSQKIERYKKIGDKYNELNQFKNKDDGSNIEMFFIKSGEKVSILNQEIVRRCLQDSIASCNEIFEKEEADMVSFNV